MDNALKFVKKNKGIVAIVAIILVVAVVSGIFISNSKKKTTREEITAVEKIKLTEVSNAMIDCIEEIENSSSNLDDKYVMYALERNYLLNDGDDTLTTKEIADMLNNIFAKEFNEDDLGEIGISPEMLEKNIVFDFNSKEFKINKVQKRMSEIAETSIYKYEYNDMYKEDGKYVVTYKKMLVTNPYQILNYYNDLNNKASQVEVDEETGEVIKEASGEKVDTSEINDYLKGNADMVTIRKYITAENINQVGEDQGEVKITFIEKDGKILVDSISK